jgi:hypothetical protein
VRAHCVRARRGAAPDRGAARERGLGAGGDQRAPITTPADVALAAPRRDPLQRVAIGCRRTTPPGTRAPAFERARRKGSCRSGRRGTHEQGCPRAAGACGHRSVPRSTASTGHAGSPRRTRRCPSPPPTACPPALVDEHLQGVVRRPPRPKAERGGLKVGLEDRLDDDLHGRLHDAVADRRDRQRPPLPRAWVLAQRLRATTASCSCAWPVRLPCERPRSYAPSALRSPRPASPASSGRGCWA